MDRVVIPLILTGQLKHSAAISGSDEPDHPREGKASESYAPDTKGRARTKGKKQLRPSGLSEGRAVAALPSAGTVWSVNAPKAPAKWNFAGVRSAGDLQPLTAAIRIQSQLLSVPRLRALIFHL